MSEQIATILKCDDISLLNKIKNSIEIFDNLSPAKNYNLAFSGGKDSHALLICFLLWQKISQKSTDNFTVRFADTLLETNSIHLIVDKILATITTVKFIKVKPEHSYWYWQFGIGYPVPNWRNRWCTGKLKIIPMKSSKEISITGRHLGESLARDNRLSCNSGECGIDKMSNTIDPLLEFRNCDVWDLIFYADATILYKGVFNLLKATYSENTDIKGSLRMGCFMCPVISLNKLKSNDGEGMPFRMILEKLRNARRINSPRTKKAGSIYVGDRLSIWQELNHSLLISLGYLKKEEKAEIDFLLSIGTYPKTYSQEWINSEHLRINSEQPKPIQLTLF